MKWRAAVSTALAAALLGFTAAGPMPAMVDLNKFEAEQHGQFGIGSAAQFGSADLKYNYANLPTYLFSDYFSLDLLFCPFVFNLCLVVLFM
jgi:hypothetical protein